MTIKIRELNIKATLSGDHSDTNQEDDKETLPTNSLLQTFYGNESSRQTQER